MILDRLFRRTASPGGSRTITTDELARMMAAGSTSAAGVSVTADRAMRLAAVFACVRVLAESVGQLPLHVYERRGEREKVKAVDHPLYQVLHVAPNRHMTSQEYWEWSTACLATRGNAYSQIIDVRGVVRELWPLHPDSVTPKQDRDSGEVTYDVRRSNGKVETLPSWEVFHLPLFGFDGLRGMSPLEYARESIGSAIAAEQHGAGTFARGAVPGGVLQTEQTNISEKAQDLILESWRRNHEGTSNAHRVALLHSGMKFVRTSMPSVDMQMRDSRKFSRSEIAGIWRVPAHMIGDLERATFSNIEHQALDFVTHGLMPYLTRIEQRIAFQLVQPKDRGKLFAKFNVAALLRGDMTARANFYWLMLQAGAYSSNDIRDFEDMNARPDGDHYLTPSNMLIDGKLPPAAPAKGPA